MDFFSTADLNLFYQVQETKYKADTPADQSIRQQLINGVYAKTDHWRRLIAAHGYESEFRYDWQISGRYRKYTWSRIYLQGYKSTRIYFNIGVGSQGANGYPYLFYKLDCQWKDGLSPYQISLFRNYIEDNCSDAKWNEIRIDEINQYTWNKLETETLNFIRKYEQHYLRLVELIWPNGIGIEFKLARICWNEHQWQRPSGIYGKSKSSADSHEKEKGYGYEEWLFDLDKQIDGYHYGFLQAFNKGMHEGKTYDVSLYSICDEGNQVAKRYYHIGRIHKLEVLTDAQKEQAHQYYLEQGWFAQMEQDLQVIGVNGFDFDYVKKNNLLNLRFKVSDKVFTVYNPYKLIENPSQEIGKTKRYTLQRLPIGDYQSDISESYRFKEGHNPTKTGITIYTTVSRYVKRSLEHKEIQENIYKQLKQEFTGTQYEVGTEQSTGFGTKIDIVVHHPIYGDSFYEVKTGYSAQSCIREALGQILEYAMYPEQKLAQQMIIVSPHEIEDSVARYLKHLRMEFEMEIYYQQYSREEKRLLKAKY